MKRPPRGGPLRKAGPPKVGQLPLLPHHQQKDGGGLNLQLHLVGGGSHLRHRAGVGNLQVMAGEVGVAAAITTRFVGIHHTSVPFRTGARVEVAMGVIALTATVTTVMSVILSAQLTSLP